MNNYFRITGYWKQEDLGFILDSNGMFEKLWQFSSFLVCKGIEILEVSKEDKFIDVTTEKFEENKDKIYLQAICKGRPERIENTENGITYKTIEVDDKIYTIIK